MVVLHLFFGRTVVGQAMRATAENPVAAQLMGIRVERMMTLTFLLSGFLAGGAGVLVASIVYANFDLGLIGIKSFAAAVLGGFGHVAGAMVGGLVLGVVETIGAFYVSSAFKDIIAYTLLILILLVRRRGSSGPAMPGPTEAPSGPWLARFWTLAGARVRAALAALPWLPGKSAYHLFLLDTIAIFAMLALGLQLVLGYGGILQLGYAGFFGLGAYTSAILTAKLGWPFAAALVAAMVVAVPAASS